MTSDDRHEVTVCPHLRPHLDAPPSSLSVAVYCARPGGRARVPSRDELMRFCIAGHHHDCPGYQAVRLDELFGTEVR